MMYGPLDIIWTISRVCPWNCAVCCVDAFHVSQLRNGILVSSSGLRHELKKPLGSRLSPFDVASFHLQQLGVELRFDQKLRVVDHIQSAEREVRLDFSGGDPLVVSENLDVIRYASMKLGRSSISVATTGMGLRKVAPARLAELIGHVDFTFDAPIGQNGHRPHGYNSDNLRNAVALAQRGVAVRALVPISKLLSNNISCVSEIYQTLHDDGFQAVLLMRLFPSGRGGRMLRLAPSATEYRLVVDMFRELETILGTPRVFLQCALMSLNGTHQGNSCDLGRNSLAIASDGTLIYSAWALDGAGQPIGPDWAIGNVATTSIDRLIQSEPFQEVVRRADENAGHCKVFAWLHGGRTREALFSRTDPLCSAN